MYSGISLSSGSIRGIYQLGAIHAAELNGLLVDVKYFAGTSIGSIIALLLAVGWQPLELFTHVCMNDFTQLLSYNIDIVNVFQKWGAIDTTPIREYISKLILLKLPEIPTFKTLQEQTGKHLLVTAYKLKSKHPNIYFSLETHPDMSVLDGVMLSSNIPFLFQAQNYEGYYYIDGGVFDLNPADALEEYIHKYSTDIPKIFSVSLDLRNCEEDIAIPTFADYVKELVFIVMYNQQDVKESPQIDHLKLETDTSIQLQITKTSQIKWFCSGVEQTLAYFREKNIISGQN